MVVKTPLPLFRIRLPKLFLGPDLSSKTMSCELFDCYSIWFGGFLMVQKVGEINLFFITFVNKTMVSFGLFHWSLKYLQTIRHR